MLYCIMHRHEQYSRVYGHELIKNNFKTFNKYKYTYILNDEKVSIQKYEQLYMYNIT